MTEGDDPPPVEPGPVQKASGRRRFRYDRGTEEFGRFLSFTDGVVAIALTLLVLGIEVPSPEPGKPDPQIFDILSDLWPQIFAFLLSFVIIGIYWIQHHRFVAQLRSIDFAMMVWNFVFLLLIVLMPLLAQLMGFYGQDEGAVVVYALWFVAFGIVDCGGYLLARSRDLLMYRPSRALVWFQMRVRISAPLVFLCSIPIAYEWGTEWATRSWFLIWPIGALLGRNPPDVPAGPPGFETTH
jgi:uncharacterized membrane protein